MIVVGILAFVLLGVMYGPWVVLGALAGCAVALGLTFLD